MNSNTRWGQLSLREKNVLFGIYASKGYTDLASIIAHYNSFSDGGRLTLQQWKSKMQSKYPDIEMDNDKAGYDYDSYFNDNYDAAVRQLSDLQHFPDTYKLPNHRTFSNESMYSRGPMIGGQWTNAPISNKSPFTTERFTPSNVNRRYYSDIYKENRPYSEGEIYHSFASGGTLPDHDPEHPYHYHNAEGEKVVITPEDWEANVGKPYFREIEAAVKAEQAAHPEPEYEVNPEFARDLRNSYQYNMGRGYQNYRNFGSYLPQGYSFTDEGLIVDSQGNYYVQSGYRQSPRFTYSTDNPLQFTINQGKPIERNLTFYPVNMDKRVKAPLPVDRALDVNEEYNNAINRLIEDNTTLITNKSTPINIYKYQYARNNDLNGSPMDFYHYHADVPSYPISELVQTHNKQNKFTKPKLYKTVNVPYDLNRMRRDDPDLARNFETWIHNIEDPSYHYDKPWFEPFEKYKTGTYTNKLPRKEAEKKAVISIGPLEKTFAKGGHLFAPGSYLDEPDNPPAKTYNIPTLQPIVSTADNTYYAIQPTSQEIITAADAYKKEQLQRAIEEQAKRQPVLRADTRSQQQRQADYNTAIMQETKQKANEQAAIFGRALGSNHDMTIDEVNESTLNTANLMGYMVAPYLMTTLESGYYGATGRPKEAALTAGVGYGLPILSKPVARLANKVFDFGRALVLSRELNKGINNATLTTTPIKDFTHNRFRLGDVEINDPNLMYRQTDGRALGEVASGGNRHTMFNKGSLWYGIPTESMLNPVIEPKTVGKLKLTKPNSEVAKTHLLVTRNADMTGANQKFGRVSIGPHSESSLHLNIEKSPEDRWLNEMIREWRNKNSEPGIATYVTDGGSRRVPLEGALNNSNTSIYTFDSGYGYRKVGNNLSTLNLQDVLDTKISINHVLPEEYVIPNFNSRHGSLIIPSTADTPVGWGNNPVLFLKKSTISKYPHQAFIGDGETNTVTGVFGRNKDLTNYSLSEIQETLASRIDKVKGLYLPEKSRPTTDSDMIFNSRLRRYLEEYNPDAYTGPSYDELHFHSEIPLENFKYAFLPNYETATELLPLFDKYGIKTNFDFADKRGIDLEAFRKWITDNDKDIGFKQGGKLK